MKEARRRRNAERLHAEIDVASRRDNERDAVGG